MKQMSQELTMYHSSVKDRRDEINRYSTDFANVKQSYFNQLRQNQQQMQ